MGSLSKQQRARKCLVCGSEEHRQKECRTKSLSPARTRQGEGDTEREKDERSARLLGSSMAGQKPLSHWRPLASMVPRRSTSRLEPEVQQTSLQGNLWLRLSRCCRWRPKFFKQGLTTASSTTASLKVLRVTGIAKTSWGGEVESPMALLDSGATNALRAAETEKEWLESEL